MDADREGFGANQPSIILYSKKIKIEENTEIRQI
jgi:hypothetical protein